VPNAEYFVCKVVGESMNKIIPNGSWCLFKKDPGGSREGKVVLVQQSSIQDPDFGSGYTVKVYHSLKAMDNEIWQHEAIMLKPHSTIKDYKDIVLENDALTEFKVLGIFQKVLN
jgi:hypothetical protein